MRPLFYANPVAGISLSITCTMWLVLEMSRWGFRRSGPEARTDDRLSGPLLTVCILGAIFLAELAAFAFPQLAIGWHRTALFAAGILLMLGGIAFRWYAVRLLGRYFTVVVSVRPDQPIIEAGPYHWIRHPSYSGAMLTFLGLSLTLANWLSLFLIILLAAVGYGYRIAVEEKALLRALGETYRAYMKRTKRIIPFVI